MDFLGADPHRIQDAGTAVFSSPPHGAALCKGIGKPYWSSNRYQKGVSAAFGSRPKGTGSGWEYRSSEVPGRAKIVPKDA